MELNLTRIFVKVAQNGSFSRAAELMKIPKSTISKAISRLERETGTKLLLRTTRSLTLTPAGRAFFEASLGPITQLEEAQKSLYGQDSLLTGQLRITAPEDLGSFVIAPAIAELSSRHAALSFELVYTDEIIDLVKEGFDVAVRIGRASDSSMKLKRAGEVVLIPVASPKYLKKNEKIRQPQDLKNQICLSIDIGRTAEQWILKSEKSTAQVSIKSKITCNQMTSLLQMAIAGGGVALIPRYLCKAAIESGELVRVLPDWQSPGISASILTPLAPSSSARLKMVVDHLQSVVMAALGANA